MQTQKGFEEMKDLKKKNCPCAKGEKDLAKRGERKKRGLKAGRAGHLCEDNLSE